MNKVNRKFLCAFVGYFYILNQTVIFQIPNTGPGQASCILSCIKLKVKLYLSVL